MQATATPKGAAGMSTRGQSIAAGIQRCTDQPLPPTRRTATGSASFVLGNLVAIAACLTTVLAAALATAPRALAEGAAGKIAPVPAFVTPSQVKSGALLLKSENAALASEASGQRGN